MVDLKAAAQLPGLLGGIDMVQAGQLVRVQIVHHQHDLPIRKVNIRQVRQQGHEVRRGAPLGDLHMTPAPQRSTHHEPVGRTVAFILAVHASRLSRFHRHRRTHLLRQLLGHLVDAYPDRIVVEVPVIDIQDILHGRHEVGILPGWDAPGTGPPRLQGVFLTPPRTVSVEMLSTTPISTRRSPSRVKVQPARPSGGSDPAIIVRAASPAPSSLRGLRFVCTRRSKAASRPSSTHRRRTRSTVAMLTSTIAAMSASIRPPLQDRGRLVRGDVVQNDMDIHVGIETLGHMVEEGDEVLGAVPLGHAARDVTRGDIQGGQKAGGAMADIVMGPGGRVSGVMGKGFWVRPKAGICGFSSMDSTTAWSGGFTYRPTTSWIFLAKARSRETLKVDTRWGYSRCRRKMVRTLDMATPVSWAKVLSVQWLACSGAIAV